MNTCRLFVRNALRARGRAATAAALLGAAAAPLYAQEASESGVLEEVVVTGYRHSLNVALEAKREAVGAVDAIVAEDIADFPDLNLAESIQRVPGVSIDRDAGEGRRVSVRGLGPQFTRIRINGMEALTTTGGTDAAGGTNRDRQFDFNVFASELFNSIVVRKTSAAETEEGSLGATVDLQAARPFDYDGFTFVTGVQGGYNDLSEDWNPRGALLISNTFADGRFGALFSAAYTDRSLLDEGSSTVRWQSGGAFESVAPGVPYDGATVAGAFRPRIPRYDIYEHEQERIGLTGSLQFQAAESTLLTFDALYAKLDAERTEIFLESPNFSGSLAEVDVLDAEIDATNTLVYGVFDDVDIRTEQRFDELSTEFTQFTLNAAHEFSDSVRLNALVGRADSSHDNPIQTTLLWDIANVDGYSFDYRDDRRLPLLNYGNADVTNPEAWTLTQIRLRPQAADNTFTNYLVDLAWDVSDTVTLKGGLQYKEYEFETTDRRRADGEGTVSGQAGTPRSEYAQEVNLGGDLGVPAGTTTTWVVPDLRAAAELFDLYNESVFPLSIQPALGNNFGVEEEDTGGYLQLDFRTELGGVPVRGNLGVRYVETSQTSTGWSRSPAGNQLISVKQDFSDTLPSLNLVAELTDEFLVRFGASKVMARAGLGNLNPGNTVQISGQNKVVNAGNPLLDPFRADTYDLSFEWYFAPESLLGLALFYKDIDSFVQTIRATGPFAANPLGLPDNVAIATCGAADENFDPNDPAQAAECLDNWQFSLPTNTPGGDLKGMEVSWQQPFAFLPAPFDDLGAIINYTYVDSEVAYRDATGAIVVEETLQRLSKNAANATLYYDNGVWSARVSAAYRDDFLTNIPGRNGNDVEGTNSTLTLDFSAGWAMSDNVELTLEALNLTDEFNDQWVDSTGDRLSFYHHTGRQYFLGARFRY